MLPTVLLGSGYLIIYLLLDWISYFEPYAQFAITPWNPNTGASIAFILIFGRRMILFSFIAPLLADLVIRRFAAATTRRDVVGSRDRRRVCVRRPALAAPKAQASIAALPSMRDLVILIVVTVMSAGFVAAGYVGLLVAAGLMPTADVSSAALRYWVGDVIGIMVVTPFALILWMRRSGLRISPRGFAAGCGHSGCPDDRVWICGRKQLQLFYVVFLPIIWIAVRTGIEGASIGILITQIGLILGMQLFPDGTHDMIAFQMLMLVLAITGLVVGELVTERRRTETQLRLHQESLARLARFGSVGEFAAAIAHELNQPLMAAGTYARLVEDAMRGGHTALDAVADTAKKTVAQVERAAAVVQRLASAGAARPQQSRGLPGRSHCPENY